MIFGMNLQLVKKVKKRLLIFFMKEKNKSKILIKNQKNLKK